jgi:hypothetical protein
MAPISRLDSKTKAKGQATTQRRTPSETIVRSRKKTSIHHPPSCLNNLLGSVKGEENSSTFNKNDCKVKTEKKHASQRHPKISRPSESTQVETESKKKKVEWSVNVCCN